MPADDDLQSGTVRTMVWGAALMIVILVCAVGWWLGILEFPA